MKHNLTSIEQAYEDFMEGKIDAIGIHNEIVLAKEDLQQRKKDIIETHRKGSAYIDSEAQLIDEILGEPQELKPAEGVRADG